jgi:hypothetical protein
VTVGQREVAQIRTACLGDAQRVQDEQTRQHMIVATGQAGLHE